MRNISVSVDTRFPSEEQEIVKRVGSYFSEARDYMVDHHDTWDENYDFYEGEQWDVEVQKKSKYSMTANVISPGIEQQIAYLCASRPQWDAEPRETDDRAIARRANACLDYVFNRQDFSEGSQVLARVGLITGNGFAKTFWNPTLLSGLGEIDVDIIDPKSLLPCPGVTKLARCPYIIHAQPMYLSELRALYGERAAYVKPDAAIDQTYSAKGQKPSIEVHQVSGEDVVTYGESGRLPSGEKPVRGMAWVFECWMRDEAVQEVPFMDEMGQLRATTKPMYPGGRVVTIAGGIILDDRPNPYAHGKFPFVHFRPRPNPRSLCGYDDVEDYKDQQRDYNELRTDSKEFRKLMGQGWVFVPQGGIMDLNVFRAKTGAIISYIPIEGQKPTREAPNAFPQGYLTYMDRCQGEIEYGMGVHAVNLGMAPGGGVRSGRAIGMLQQWGSARMELKRAQFELALAQIGEQVLQLIMQFWQYPRKVRVVGETGARQTALVMGVPIDPALLALDARDVMSLQGMFDVRVVPHSTVERDPDRDLMVAFQQAQMGLLAPERILELAGLPGWESDVERILQQQVMQQQMLAKLPERERMNVLMGRAGKNGETPEEPAPQKQEAKQNA